MLASIRQHALSTLRFVWRWSVPYNSRNRSLDTVYASVWSIGLDDPSIIAILHQSFPDIPLSELPLQEEAIRRLIRLRFPLDDISSSDDDSDSVTQLAVPSSSSSSSSSPSSSSASLNDQDEKHDATTPTASAVEITKTGTVITATATAIPTKPKPLTSPAAAEETWSHVPVPLRALLASLNAQNLEAKLTSLHAWPHHTRSGRASVGRAASGLRRILAVWRHGRHAAIGRPERWLTHLFVLFLVFSACYADTAAALLGERSYNQRSVGGRVVTLCQLWFLVRCPHHSLWLLFNWSLERLLGAAVGSAVYALAAVVPSVRATYRAGDPWFRVLVLVLSMCWQVGVQFTPPARDYVVRVITRRQMASVAAVQKRRRRDGAAKGEEAEEEEEKQVGDAAGVVWDEAVRTVDAELTTLSSFTAHLSPSSDPAAEEVPFQVRAERFIQYTAQFELGRPTDQIVSLFKDDLEVLINTYHDYQDVMSRRSSGSPSSTDREKGHVEPRTQKLVLVLLDVVIFAYVCYSFFPQPFTFNTVVAYGTVVCVKQAIIACKRYQTPRAARRLFTNMVSINILGVFLVSTPVTVDRHVLDNDAAFVALTLAMIFATLFLAETVAPVLIGTVEGGVRAARWVRGVWCRNIGRRRRTEESDAADQGKVGA